MNNYIKYNTQSLASPQEEEAVPANSEVIAARPKAKAKPQPRESSGTTTIPLSERIWIDVEPSGRDLGSRGLSKKVINLLRQNRKYIESKMEQFNSARLNSIYGIILFQYKIGRTIDG